MTGSPPPPPRSGVVIVLPSAITRRVIPVSTSDDWLVGVPVS